MIKIYEGLNNQHEQQESVYYFGEEVIPRNAKESTL
jgi:hypothetical protein